MTILSHTPHQVPQICPGCTLCGGSGTAGSGVCPLCNGSGQCRTGH